MDNSAIAHQNMVTNQVLPNKVREPRLVQALLDIPRHEFVPEQLRSVAYVDENLPMGKGRSLLNPATFARIVEAAHIAEGDKVLDIGCATGYSAAVLSRLAAKVAAVECDPEMASVAHRRMKRFDIKNVIVIDGNLVDGHPEEGPYNVIIVNGAIPEVPETLAQQLTERGRLLAIIQSPEQMIGQVTLFENYGNVLSSRTLFETSADMLPGFEN